MKKIFLLLLFSNLIISCKNRENKKHLDAKTNETITKTIDTINEVNNIELEKIKKPILKKEEIHKGEFPKDFKLMKPRIYQSIKNKKFYLLSYASIGNYEVLDEIQNLDIDTAEIFGGYLVDKNTVYNFFHMSDGIRVQIMKGVDRETFEVFGNTIYSKDKNNVYENRHGVIKDADIETFEPIKIGEYGSSCYAKDKNNTYWWDEATPINKSN